MDVNVTAEPSTDVKPLGFYFSKDIPGHVKEKALGVRNKLSSSMPTGGKAELGLYFNNNTHSANSSMRQSAVEPQMGPDAATSSKSATQSINFGRKQSTELTNTPDTKVGRVNSQNMLYSMHRKELRDLSMGVQPPSKPLDSNGRSSILDNSTKDFERLAIDKSHTSLVIAVNSATGKFESQRKTHFLNSDDV